MSDLPDSGHRTNFNTGAVRDASEGKGHPSSIPPTAIRRIAKRFEDGARKYKNHNWAQGMPLSRTADSAMRHITSFLEGDKTEDHLGAAAWNLCVLMQFEDWLGKGLLPEELDDRLYAKENPVAWAREQCAEGGWEWVSNLSPEDFVAAYRSGRLTDSKIDKYIHSSGRPKPINDGWRFSVCVPPDASKGMTPTEYMGYSKILSEKYYRKKHTEKDEARQPQRKFRTPEEWSRLYSNAVKDTMQSTADNPATRYAVVLRHDLSNYIGVFIKQRDAEDFMARLAAATNGHCEFDIIALP